MVFYRRNLYNLFIISYLMDNICVIQRCCYWSNKTYLLTYLLTARITDSLPSAPFVNDSRSRFLKFSRNSKGPPRSRALNERRVRKVRYFQRISSTLNDLERRNGYVECSPHPCIVRTLYCDALSCRSVVVVVACGCLTLSSSLLIVFVVVVVVVVVV